MSSPSWKTRYISNNEIGPQSALTVNDNFAQWQPRHLAAAQPAVNAASVFTDLLRANGVSVVGVPAQGVVPPRVPSVASIDSLPMSDLVGEMLRESDNLTAELLTKELGVKTAKSGTTAAGVAATTAKLKELGVPIADGALKDGSGLDRGNRVTCDNLVATLALADRPELATLHDGLPVAGQNGTLFDQFIGTTLAGNFRGKTGSLDGVSGLTGVLEAGRLIRFAFLDNGSFSEAQGAVVRVRIGDIVGRFPDAPPVDALVPAPQ